MAESNGFGLLSNSKTSDSRQSVQLHPLAILTISDYITRHLLRHQSGPICGAILGAQNGRDITMEHAFECKLETKDDASPQIDAGWFHDRLQQYKEVHKTLDFVGWFTLASPGGPESYHLAIHNQILSSFNESALLLAFEPSSLADGSTRGGKLPLAVYENVWEVASDDGDKHMQTSGDGSPLVLRFRELPYSIESGDAEMIGVDFVARGGANAAVDTGTSSRSDVGAASAQTPSGGRGKGKAKEVNGGQLPTAELSLSAEEEETIASLTAKANATRMLRQRISLIKSYLAHLPPCYLNDASVHTFEANAQISHPILRSISSLLARLPLLTPSTPAASSALGNTEGQGQPQLSMFSQESAAQEADVALVSLLGKLGDTLQSASGVSKKYSIVEHARSISGRGRFPLPSGMGDPSGFGTHEGAFA